MRKKKSPLLDKKRPKIACEICGEQDQSTLHRHHIVERTEINTSNHDLNLCVVCGNCHSKIHANSIKIIGIWPGTRPPTGRILVYVKDGICNVPGLEDLDPPYKAILPAMKWDKDEEK